jgi:spermidine synthase
MFYIDYLKDFGLSEREIALFIYIITSRKVKLKHFRNLYRKDLEKLIKLGILNTLGKNISINLSLDFYSELSNPEIIFEIQSKFQKIQLLKAQDGSLFLRLNNVNQFHTDEVQRSHEMMVSVPLMYSKYIDEILILGGGDGLATSKALEFSPKSITLVEIDAEMVKMTKNIPEMRELCNDSLNDSRVNVIIGDAIKYLLNTNKTYDVIIDDCGMKVTNQIPNLKWRIYKRYLKNLVKKINLGGVVSYMEEMDLWEIFRYTSISEIEQGINNLAGLQINDIVNKLDIFFFNCKKYKHLRYKYHESKFLGPELYIYLSNTDFSLKRNLPSTTEHLKNFKFD